MLSETVPLSADADQDRLPGARPSSRTQPIVIVFDSKPRYQRQKHAKKPRKEFAAGSGKTFAFVNISRPGNADEESRRLVKTHVMQDVLRRKSGHQFNPDVKFPERLYISQDFSQSVEGRPQAPPSYRLTFPIHTEPYMLKLVHDYAGVMLPTESKAISSAWFSLIMTDAALFHALLCTSALLGWHNITVQRKHMLESIRLINCRLRGDGATSDATITAILFMAKAEYFQGNHGAWSVHMGGVKKIVELRGGIGILSRLIQQKVYSTDLLGCMETGTLPHFPAINLPKPSSSTYPCNLPSAVISLVQSCTLDPDFLALLSEIETHTTSSSATHDTPSLQYRLLSLHAMRQHQHSLASSVISTEHTFSSVQQTQSEIIKELLFIGALLFLSLPQMHAPTPIRPIDHGYLLSRLIFSASPLLRHYTLSQHPEFFLWLFFLGEIFSSISTLSSTSAREHSPFRLQLRAVSVVLNIASWEDTKMALSTMWAFEPKYDNVYQSLWEEAKMGYGIS